MNSIMRKLTSRKLWIALCGLIAGIAAAFGIESNEYAQIAGVVTSAISVVSYIFGEAEIDKARAASGNAKSSDEANE